MTKTVSLCAVSQKTTPLLQPQFHVAIKDRNVPLSASPEVGAFSFPPLINGPACRLTEEEWQRINHGMFLTAREMDVVKGMMIGETEAGIAAQLGISTNTVHTHLGRVYKKLGVHGASGLILRVFSAYAQIMRMRTQLQHENASPSKD